MSTLLGCIIAEHSCIVNCGMNKCSESFLRHLLRMIMVCIYFEYRSHVLIMCLYVSMN